MIGALITCWLITATVSVDLGWIGDLQPVVVVEIKAEQGKVVK